MSSEPTTPETPETWADAEQQTAEFQALLARYDNDYQKAVDAQRRGERADPGTAAGSANPM